jgi:hypothetical protein
LSRSASREEREVAGGGNPSRFGLSAGITWAHKGSAHGVVHDAASLGHELTGHVDLFRLGTDLLADKRAPADAREEIRVCELDEVSAQSCTIRSIERRPWRIAATSREKVVSTPGIPLGASQ